MIEPSNKISFSTPFRPALGKSSIILYCRTEGGGSHLYDKSMKITLEGLYGRVWRVRGPFLGRILVNFRHFCVMKVKLQFIGILSPHK